jgi:hypothetical protein
MKNLNLFLSALAILSLVSGLAAQNLPAYVPQNGLVGWWPFNGNANDESGNNNHGVVNGATLAADRYGDEDAAYRFDGHNDFIIVNNATSVSLQNGTISFWIKTNNQTNRVILIKNNFSNATGEEYGFATQGMSVKYGSNCWSGFAWSHIYINNNYNILDDKWHMITGVIGPDSLFLYADAILMGKIAAPNTFPDQCSSFLNFGRNWSVDPKWYDGVLDDIGIWNRVLSHEEIRTLFSGVSVNVQNAPEEIKIDLFPNPATDQITIQYPNAIGNEAYTIYDLTGKIVRSGKLSGTTTIVSLQTLPSGSYLLKVNDKSSFPFVVIK